MLDCAFDSDGEPSEECASCERPMSDLPTEPDGYEYWPACPNRLRLLPMWQDVVRGWNAARVCPLSDWPRGYVAWYVHGLSELQAAFGRKAERRDKEADPGQAFAGFSGNSGRPRPRGPTYGGRNPWR
jgi:hypothetical protein